jgi:hypothetical protein
MDGNEEYAHCKLCLYEEQYYVDGKGKIRMVG